MFKTSQDFEQSLFNVLNAVHSSPDNIDSWQNGLSDIELNDVLEHALNHGLLTGMDLDLSSHEELSISLMSPRLTYEGLKFIEQQ